MLFGKPEFFLLSPRQRLQRRNAATRQLIERTSNPGHWHRRTTGGKTSSERKQKLGCWHLRTSGGKITSKSSSPKKPGKTSIPRLKTTGRQSGGSVIAQATLSGNSEKASETTEVKMATMTKIEIENMITATANMAAEKSAEPAANRAAEAAIEKILPRLEATAEKAATDAVNKLASTFEERLKALESRPSGPAASSYGGGGSVAYGSSAGNRPAPSSVEVTGFVNYEGDAEATSILWSEAKSWISRLALDQEVRCLIDDEKTDFANSFNTLLRKIVLRLPNPSQESAIVLRDAINRKVSQMGAAAHINERCVRARIELSQERRPFARAAAIWHGAAGKARTPRDSYKLEFTKESVIAMRLIGDRPRKVASWSQVTGWELITTEWAKFSIACTADQMREYLTSS